MKLFKLGFALVLLGAQMLSAAESALEVDGSDTLRSILERQTGQVIEVRLKNGDKLNGKVANVGDKLLHLSQLTGQEFFDAVIDVKDVTAVIVRTKSK